MIEGGEIPLIAGIMDTRLCDAAFTLADGADMLVCESTFAEAEAALARDYGHLTAGQAGRIAAESDARLLVLTHFSQRYGSGDSQRLAAEAAMAFGGEVVLAPTWTGSLFRSGVHHQCARGCRLRRGTDHGREGGRVPQIGPRPRRSGRLLLGCRPRPAAARRVLPRRRCAMRRSAISWAIRSESALPAGGLQKPGESPMVETNQRRFCGEYGSETPMPTMTVSATATTWILGAWKRPSRERCPNRSKSISW